MGCSVCGGGKKEDAGIFVCLFVFFFIWRPHSVWLWQESLDKYKDWTFIHPWTLWRRAGFVYKDSQKIKQIRQLQANWVTMDVLFDIMAQCFRNAGLHKLFKQGRGSHATRKAGADAFYQLVATVSVFKGGVVE